MSINIGRHSFEGPYSDTDYLQNRSGIYAILDDQSSTTYVVDIGESADVKSRVESHDRKDCWQRNHRGTLKIAVLYTPNLQQSGRMAIEQELRDKFQPVCGVR